MCLNTIDASLYRYMKGADEDAFYQGWSSSALTEIGDALLHEDSQSFKVEEEKEKCPDVGYIRSYLSNTSETQHDFLIPGLPNDVGKLCIALVPRSEFPSMSRVSKAWMSLLQSKEFHLMRTHAGTLEEWLYTLTVRTGLSELRWRVLSSNGGSSMDLPPMPSPVQAGFCCVVVNGKLLVIGGLMEEKSKCTALADVLKYDSALNRWSKVASMHIARYEFGCAVVGDCVYVVGGHGEGGRNLASVEVYDPEKDLWTHIPGLKRARWGCIACGLEGKVFVMGGHSSFTIGHSRLIDVYNPATREWDEVKNGCIMVLSHAILDRKLFCIEWKNDRTLVVFNAADNSWKKVALPVTGSFSIGFCLGNLNGKLLLLPTTGELSDALFYDPNATTRDSEWQTATIKPYGTCIYCATIAA